MNFKEELDDYYKSTDCDSKLEFTGRYIFDFTTYQSGIDELLATKMLEVCDVILNGTTYEYIEDKNNLLNYIMMVNYPFLISKIEWGTSIRGAWFDESLHPTKQKNIFINHQLSIQSMRLKEFIKELIEWTNEK